MLVVTIALRLCTNGLSETFFVALTMLLTRRVVKRLQVFGRVLDVPSCLRVFRNSHDWEHVLLEFRSQASPGSTAGESTHCHFIYAVSVNDLNKLHALVISRPSLIHRCRAFATRL